MVSKRKTLVDLTINVLAMAATASAFGQDYNRDIRTSDILISGTQTPGLYSILPSARVLNATTDTLDLGTRFDIAVNGNLVGSLQAGVIVGGGGQTCGGGCNPGNCPSGSECTSLGAIGRDGCACAVIITPNGNGIALNLNAGDLVSVQLAPLPGSQLEVHNSDDFAQTTFMGCVSAAPGFTSERFGALPTDRMQLVAYYDGTGLAELDIHLTNPSSGACCILTISGIDDNPLTVQEYVMNGFVPTGKFVVRNVVPNGAVDGVAFGLYWRDATGARWKLQSRSTATGSGTPNFVGMWPYSWADTFWDGLMPPIVDDGFKRRQAQVNLSGAQVLGNGTWGIPTGRVPGDSNGDGCVDLVDLTFLLSTFGACCP